VRPRKSRCPRGRLLRRSWRLPRRTACSTPTSPASRPTWSALTATTSGRSAASSPLSPPSSGSASWGGTPDEADVDAILAGSFYLPFAGTIPATKLRESARRRVRRYVRRHGDELRRTVRPEVSFEVPLANARVRGRIDLMLRADGGGERQVELVDFKTSENRPPLGDPPEPATALCGRRGASRPRARAPVHSRPRFREVRPYRRPPRRRREREIHAAPPVVGGRHSRGDLHARGGSGCLPRVRLRRLLPPRSRPGERGVDASCPERSRVVVEGCVSGSRCLSGPGREGGTS
jgi:hypothetical protein